eukprot:TRINITY_DN23552_c0_g1_i1.p1 TRINITY_DN23552_c0_g1~~TRINITY_DN23552_c0_g1_i1.p1  ORF type:complete len:1046 (+),score=294.00 TRINITY_DN23552_c0_g1_i1:215-3352(+)
MMRRLAPPSATPGVHAGSREGTDKSIDTVSSVPSPTLSQAAAAPGMHSDVEKEYARLAQQAAREVASLRQKLEIKETAAKEAALLRAQLDQASEANERLRLEIVAHKDLQQEVEMLRAQLTETREKLNAKGISPEALMRDAAAQQREADLLKRLQISEEGRAAAEWSRTLAETALRVSRQQLEEEREKNVQAGFRKVFDEDDDEFENRPVAFQGSEPLPMERLRDEVRALSVRLKTAALQLPAADLFVAARRAQSRLTEILDGPEAAEALKKFEKDGAAGKKAAPQEEERKTRTPAESLLAVGKRSMAASLPKWLPLAARGRDEGLQPDSRAQELLSPEELAVLEVPLAAANRSTQDDTWKIKADGAQEKWATAARGTVDPTVVATGALPVNRALSQPPAPQPPGRQPDSWQIKADGAHEKWASAAQGALDPTIAATGALPVTRALSRPVTAEPATAPPPKAVQSSPPPAVVSAAAAQQPAYAAAAAAAAGIVGPVVYSSVRTGADGTTIANLKGDIGAGSPEPAPEPETSSWFGGALQRLKASMGLGQEVPPELVSKGGREVQVPKPAALVGNTESLQREVTQVSEAATHVSRALSADSRGRVVAQTTSEKSFHSHETVMPPPLASEGPGLLQGRSPVMPDRQGIGPTKPFATPQTPFSGPPEHERAPAPPTYEALDPPAKKGDWLAMACKDGALRILDVASGSLLKELPGVPQAAALPGAVPAALSLAYNASGTRLVVAYSTGQLRIFTTHDFGEVMSFSLAKAGSPPISVHALAWHPAAQQTPAGNKNMALIVAACSDKALKVIDPAAGAVRQEVAHRGGEVRALAWSSDGQLVATGCDDGRLRLISAGSSSFEVVHEVGHGNRVLAVVFGPGDKTIASGCEDGRLRIMVAKTGQITKELPMNFDVHSISWRMVGSPGVGGGAKSMLVGGCSDGKLRVFDLASGRTEKELELGGVVRSLTLNQSGMMMAAASTTGSLCILKMATGARNVAPVSSEIHALAWSPAAADVPGMAPQAAAAATAAAPSQPPHGNLGNLVAAAATP